VPFKKARVVIPSLIVLAAVAAGGAQLWAEHQARLRVDEMLANLPMGANGHYSDVSYNLFTHTLRLNGLTVARNDNPLIAVRHVVLHHLSGNGDTGTPFHAEAVSLTGLDIWRNGRHVKVGDVEAHDVAILAPGVPVPAGTPSWLIAPEEGTPVSVGAVQANAISDDQGVSIVALAVDGYQTGRVREASLSHYQDGHGNAVESAAGTAIDLDGLDRVFNVERYTPGAPGWTAPRTLIGHLDVADVTAKGPQGDSHIDHLTIDNLAARPFAAAPTEEAVKTPAFARDAAAAIAIGNGTVLNVHVTDTRTDSAASLEHLAVTGYQDGAVGRFTLNHLTASEHGKTVASLGHFEVNGLNATALLHAPPDDSTADLIAAAQGGGLKLSSLAIADVSFPLPDSGTVTMKSLTESVAYGKPIQTSFALSGLSVPANATPQLAQLLQPLGVDPVVLSLKETASYDPDTGDTTVDSATLAAAQLGSIDLSGQFTNLPRSLPKDDDLANALGQIGIGAFSLSYTNDSLVQRVVAGLAKQSGKTPAEIMDGARAAASFFAAAAVPSQDDAGQQIANFLTNPKRLTLTASPIAPVPLANFQGQDYHAAQAALNLHLSAN
jgi:hypothetical protein